MDEAKTNGSGNGHDPNVDALEFRAAQEELRSLETSILLARSNFLRQIGVTHEGARDLWSVLGYSHVLTTRQYVEQYARGGIAGRIVDTFPNATWRGEVELIEDEDPEVNTPFEQAWQDLDQRLQIQSKLLRVDKLAGLSTYAVLLIGAPGELSTELPKVNNAPEKLLYLQPFLGGGGPASGSALGASMRVQAQDADCTIAEYVTDAKDPRFGLPLTYQLKRVEVASPDFQKPVHWTRIIHIAEGLLSDDVFGQPSLERVWNLLQDLEKVTGGGAEAFWLRANQGLHLDIDKDMALPDVQNTITALKEQSEAYKHQLTRWLRTRGVSVETLGSDVANFANPADAILTQIAGAKGIPKRVLTGSEMGELASSQDRENFKDQINGRQTGYAGPYIVRPLVDRLIAYGYLPTPSKGAMSYEVKWPHIQVLTEQEKAEGAVKWASVNATQGEPVFTEAEIRDHWYFMAPLTDEQRAEIDDRKAEALKMQAEAMAAMAPPAAKEDEEKKPGKVLPFKAAEEAEDAELIRVLAAAIEADNGEVIAAIIGLGGKGSGHFGHEGRPGQVGGSEAGDGGSFPGRNPRRDPFPEWSKSHPPTTHTVGSSDSERRNNPQVIVQELGGSNLAETWVNSTLDDDESHFESLSPKQIHQEFKAWKEKAGEEHRLNPKQQATGENIPTAAKHLKVGDKIPDMTYGSLIIEKVFPFDPKYPKSQVVETSRGRRDLDPDRILYVTRSLGGPGSSNFGHEGRPGQIGGSAPQEGSGGSDVPVSSRRPYQGYDPIHAYVEAYRQKGHAIEQRPSGAQATKLHAVYSALEQALSDPDIGMEVMNAMTSGGSLQALRDRLRDLETGRAVIIGGKAPSPYRMPKQGQTGAATIPFARAAEDRGTPQERAIVALRKLIEALENPETAEFTQQLIEDVRQENATRSLGGPGSGHFGHAGRPGQEGGSAPGDGDDGGEDSLSNPISRSGETKPLGQGGINGAMKLKTPEGKDFLFKPIASEKWIFGGTVFRDGSGKHSGVKGATLGEREVLASRVSREIGLGVPNAQLGKTEQGAEGAVIDWVDGAGPFWEESPHPLRDEISHVVTREVVRERMDTFDREQRATQVVFDTIIGNADRHRGNFMVKENKLVSIDHGYSFGLTVPLDQASEETYYDHDTKTNLRVFASMRNVAIAGISDNWLSKDQQNLLASKIEKINWKRVLRGTKLSTGERDALRSRTDRVVQRLRAGEVGKLREDFEWKQI